jgi:hypothetical protein
MELAREIELEKKIWWAYHWPSKPFKTEEFPYSIQKNK